MESDSHSLWTDYYFFRIRRRKGRGVNIAAIISGVRQSTATNTYTVGTVRREAELRMEMGESEGGEEMSRRCRTVHCLPPAANERTMGHRNA